MSDSFRTLIPDPGANALTREDAVERLTSLVGGSFVASDRITLIRHGGFWRRRNYEPPEAAARLLEAAGPRPGLADYVRFVGALDRNQSLAFGADDGPRLRVASGCLREAMPALHILAKLDSSREDLMLKGNQVNLHDHRIQPVIGEIRTNTGYRKLVLEGYVTLDGSGAKFGYEFYEAMMDGFFKGRGKYGRPRLGLAVSTDSLRRLRVKEVGATPEEAARRQQIKLHGLSGLAFQYATLRMTGRVASLLLGTTQTDGLVLPIDLDEP